MLSKLERVERTLNLLPVDRVAIHDYISGNDPVVAHYKGKNPPGLAYSLADSCEVVRKTLDLWRPPFNMVPDIIEDGTSVVEDGFAATATGWTSWITEHPFSDTKSLKEYLLLDIEKTSKKIDSFDAERERRRYRETMLYWKDQLKDDTVLMSLIHAPLREYLWRVGIVLFTYLYYDEPEVVELAMHTYLLYQLKIIEAAADGALSPVVLIATEASSKKGPIFGIDFFSKNLFPEIKSQCEAFHRRNVKVLVEIQGDCKMLIDHYLACGADGFYAIEPVAGMDIVELKNKYPQAVWACGVDGIELMACDNPDKVRREVRRQIEETDCLNRGGLFLGTSSEINPNIRLENYLAMVDEAASIRNQTFGNR